MIDVIDMIDKQLEKARDLLYDMQNVIKKLEVFSNELYEKKLNMIVLGYSEDKINQLLLTECQKFLSQLSAIADRKEGGEEDGDE